MSRITSLSYGDLLVFGGFGIALLIFSATARLTSYTEKGPYDITVPPVISSTLLFCRNLGLICTGYVIATILILFSSSTQADTQIILLNLSFVLSVLCTILILLHWLWYTLGRYLMDLKIFIWYKTGIQRNILVGQSNENNRTK